MATRLWSGIRGVRAHLNSPPRPLNSGWVRTSPLSSSQFYQKILVTKLSCGFKEKLDEVMDTLKNNALLLPSAATAIIVFFSSLCIYRLYFHPLAKFPGPKLAAITRFYEAYYDIIQNGQYTFKIAELHKEYGPIIRISPYELHINDSSYFEKLYRQDGHWDKYAWSYDAFSAKYSAICTLDHNIHRRRRAALNRFFSKSAVGQKQDMVQTQVDKLCSRINEMNGSKANLGSAISAFTRDVATLFLLGRSFRNLDQPDFNENMTGMIQNSGHIWRITKHVRWFGPTMRSLPHRFIRKMGNDGAKAFLIFLEDVMKIACDIATANSSPRSDSDTPNTLVHEILNSDLPEAEKSLLRLDDEIGTITGAAFETSAQTLRVIVYHVYSNREILERLRAELSSTDCAKLVQLEQLPYLTAVLMEGLRLCPGSASRLARIAPNTDLVYDDWVIPAGTPVGMTLLLMHMDERLYPEPKRFSPQRWLDMDPEERKRSDKRFAPFSRGTRMCLGMYLAWAELYMCLAEFVRQFDFDFDGIEPNVVEVVSDQFISAIRDPNALQAYVKRI